jgi:integrase
VSAWAEPAPSPRRGGPLFTWDQVRVRAPQMAATMARYLEQLAVTARPMTVAAYDDALRIFAGQITEFDPGCRRVADVERRHIEAHKTWLAARPGRKKGASKLAPATISQRFTLLRSFFERLIDADEPDAPRRCPILAGDFPRRDEPLPKSLDDPTAAKFMAALAADPDRRRRVMVELLARTGMRAGELAALPRDAMVEQGNTHWLRIPVGKLHNDRQIPLHPILVELIGDWLAVTPPGRTGRMFERNDGQPFERRTIGRYVAAVAKRAGIGHVHPHQLRHTLATQAINRKMSLEAIAALLGHRSMRMTLTYARISDQTIAEEYFRVSDAVEQTYAAAEPTAADPAEHRLAADHRRMLGNGHCGRPVALDCRFETICEGCGFYETSVEFKPTLRRQRDHATDHGQTDRAQLYTELLERIDGTP